MSTGDTTLTNFVTKYEELKVNYDGIEEIIQPPSKIIDNLVPSKIKLLFNNQQGSSIAPYAIYRCANTSYQYTHMFLKYMKIIFY